MPELPEVEAMRRLAETYCVGRVVSSVRARESGGGPRDGSFDDKVIGEGVSQARLEKALLGRKVVAAQRHGKHMWLEFNGDGPFLLFHFGMTGALAIDGVPRFSFQSFNVDQSWPPRFTKLQLEFGSGKNMHSMAFVDPRRFGRILLRNCPREEPPISLLGPDPMAGPLVFEDFARALERSAAPVKSVLLDQEGPVCGVGNWVADEVLHEALILPSAPAQTLSEQQVFSLYKSVRTVCQAAVAVDADAEKFPRHWLFHSRWGKKGIHANGGGGTASVVAEKGGVAFTVVGGRTTAYVPSRQLEGQRPIKSLATQGGAPRKRPASALDSGRERQATRPKPTNASAASQRKPAGKLQRFSVPLSCTAAAPIDLG